MLVYSYRRDISSCVCCIGTWQRNHAERTYRIRFSKFVSRSIIRRLEWLYLFFKVFTCMVGIKKHKPTVKRKIIYQNCKFQFPFIGLSIEKLSVFSFVSSLSVGPQWEHQTRDWPADATLGTELVRMTHAAIANAAADEEQLLRSRPIVLWMFSSFTQTNTFE